MSKYIKNYDQIATTQERQDALAVVEAAYAAIDTETVLHASVRVEGKTLHIVDRQFDLDKYDNIYVVGLGKVSCKAAYVLEHILDEHVAGGAAVGIKEMTCQTIHTFAGSHPLPSNINFKATQHIEEVCQKAGENDLVLVVVSGGGSALLCSSQGECDQGQKLYKEFLSSGGTIAEINTVRQHLSKMKGGGLAKMIYPASAVGLIFSDVPDGDPSVVASGPTYFDQSTMEDAQALIDKYDLGEYDLTETPKDKKYFEKIDNILLVSNDKAVDAMNTKARELGYVAKNPSADLYDLAPEVISRMKAEAEPGSVVIGAGETRVVIPEGCNGKGGRNDYLALVSLDKLEDDQLFISFASDGRDNSEAAGAIADSETRRKALEKNLSAEEFVPCADPFPFFLQTEDQIITGSIEANVSDLMLLLTPKNNE